MARVRELENIRSFLTGNAITVVLDLFFSIVFLAVMAYYSVWLTLIVVASLPCYVVLSLAFTPTLRARLNEKFNRGAENQSFLVETISGVETVKASAVEPQWIRKWDNQLAAYVKAAFRTTAIGTVANGGVTFVSKLVTVATMWLGARLVIDGQLTVGQLIAFNMLSGNVAGPVMRLAQLWTDFQQVGISMQRLGDILNTRTEVHTPRPACRRCRAASSSTGSSSVTGRRAADAARRVAAGAAGRGRGHRRPFGLGQKHADQAGAAAVPARAGAGAGGWRGHLHHRCQLAAAADRRGAAGERAVQPQHPRQHRARIPACRCGV